MSLVALAFYAEHPVRGLPAIADLATNRAAGCVMATFRRGINRNARGRCSEIPAFAGGPTAAVDSDVETAPVIDGRNHRRRRLGVGTGREIRSRSRRSQQARSQGAQCDQSDSTQQKLFHRISLRLSRSLRLERKIGLKRGDDGATAAAIKFSSWLYTDSSRNAVSEMQHSRAK